MEAMSCVVCSGPTSLRCSGCRSVFYCSRGHQKQHWSEHKRECKQSYALSQSERLGRHLVAARDLEAGELLLREVALVVGPKAASSCVCLGCHQELTPPAHSCPGCGWPLCSADCRASPHHASECSLLEKAGIGASALLHAALSAQVAAYSFVTPLRCLLVKRASTRSWDTLNSLQSHVEERLSTPAYVAYRQNVAKFIGDVLGLYGDGFDENAILKMCGILDTNSFEVKWVPKKYPSARLAKVRALFPLTSMIAHDCRPNTRHTFEQEDDGAVPWGRLVMSVYTSVPVRKGEVLTATYTQSLWPTKRRRAHLKMAKCFSCECQRCCDPTELGTNFGAIRCFGATKGCEGLLVPLNPLEETSKWKCTVCRKEIPSTSMDSLNSKLHDEILERASKVNQKLAENGRMKNIPKTDPEILEEFLVKYRKELHPLNHHAIQVKYALNQIYGKIPGHPLKTLSNEKIKRKEELCHQLLEAANILEPGLTRLRADLLIDLHETAQEISRRNISSTRKSKKSSKVEEEDAEKLLKDALKVLATEKQGGSIPV
ncbi:SET domain-containing protein SmydA-8-like isoform X2 [Ischnura elegans]|uniref:SET domain-containing protein SmydA-8-like isoform X2 n=1 Tax=Ischnura elegans TaxID=197161 RepID=UPI001ED8A42B|nr:SET domain-containing protein SmydA-8-like isoform X2 [Ischnura elegans]